MITIEVSRDGWTKKLQLAIGQEDERGVGDGYRLAGPKFNGSGESLLKATLSERDAQQIRAYLDREFPVPVEGNVSVFERYDDEVPSEWTLVDALHCELCKGPVGFMSSDGDSSGGWVSIFAFESPGDAGPTLFCEDCAGWLENFGVRIGSVPAAAVEGTR